MAPGAASRLLRAVLAGALLSLLGPSQGRASGRLASVAVPVPVVTAGVGSLAAAAPLRGPIAAGTPLGLPATVAPSPLPAATALAGLSQTRPRAALGPVARADSTDLARLFDGAIAWRVEAPLLGGVTRGQLDDTAVKVLTLLREFDRPKVIGVEVSGEGMALSISGSEKVSVAARVRNEQGEARHPRLVLNVLAHELTHPIMRESIHRRAPEATALLEKPEVAEKMQALMSRVGRDGEDTRALMAELRALSGELDRHLWKAHLLKGYDELMADLVAVIVSKDPRAVYRALASQRKNDPIYETSARHRRFDVAFTKARVEAWRRDMARLDRALGRGGKPDPYLAFAPARAWLWEHLRGKIETGNPALASDLKVLLEVMVSELRARTKEIDQAGSVDLLEVNRALVARFLGRTGA